jgi:hypothetical protein
MSTRATASGHGDPQRIDLALGAARLEAEALIERRRSAEDRRRHTD